MSRPLKLRLTEAAEADLADIWTYLALNASETVANRFVQRIAASFEPIRHFPDAAPSRGHLATGLRVTFHAHYAIHYLARRGEVIILRVVHGARDIAGLIDPVELT